MNSSKLLFFVLLFSVLVGIGYSSTNVSSCMDITSSGVYILNSNLVSPDGSSCINIKVSNVVLDLNGHSISGVTSSGSASIYVSTYFSTHGMYLKNITIANGTVNNSNYGIYMMGVNNSIIRNVTAHDNAESGFDLELSSNNTLTLNNAFNNWGGFHLSSSSNHNNLTLNNAYNNTLHGFYLGSSSNNTLSQNNAYDNNWNGFHLWSSSDNRLINNNAYKNSKYGFSLRSSSNNTLTSNNVSNNGGGFDLSSDSNHNNLTSNNVYDNIGDGLHLSSSSNNTLISNNDENNNKEILYAVVLISIIVIVIGVYIFLLRK